MTQKSEFRISMVNNKNSFSRSNVKNAIENILWESLQFWLLKCHTIVKSEGNNKYTRNDRALHIPFIPWYNYYHVSKLRVTITSRLLPGAFIVTYTHCHCCSCVKEAVVHDLTIHSFLGVHNEKSIFEWRVL